MSSGEKVWIGADPGGKGNFGIAILQSNGSFNTCCVNCTDEAIQWVVQYPTLTPTGVG